tara:strand:+ start:5866 stop:7737 length:1872 start_codon:yes stop_codon:yes gene_type:complete
MLRPGVNSLPFDLRVNHSVFPVSVLSFSARRDAAVAELNVEIMGLDARLHGVWGDPVTRGPRSLDVSRPLDVYVFTTESSTEPRVSLAGVEIPTIVTLDDFLLLVSWSSTSGNRRSDDLVILWRASDRRAGRNPVQFQGNDAMKLREYATKLDRRFPAALGHGRRVRSTAVAQATIRRRSMMRSGAGDVDATTDPVRASELTLRGLRGFRDDAHLRLAQPTGAPGSGLTIVVGANNAGKSTVWEAFDALARKAKYDISFSEGSRNRLSADGVYIRLERADGSAYVLRSRNPDTSETTGAWDPGDPDGGDPQPFEVVSVPSRRQFQASFSKNITSQRDWMTSGSDFSRSRQFDQSSQFTGRLFDLHNDDAKKSKFDLLMTEVLGHDLNWKIDLADGQQGQSYYLKISTGAGVNHTSEGLGDGIISLLFIVNALYDSEPGTLVTIDEPELSLHPQHVRRLGRLISRFARDRQIVVFTHSPALVSWDDIASGAEIARVYKNEDQSKIAQASRAVVDDVSRARGGWVNPHVFGSDANSTLFLDDGVIVVEGQEDAALLPRAFAESEVRFNGSIFGWGSGGQGNVRRILALLLELGFTRVAAVLDNDVPDTVARLGSAPSLVDSRGLG